MLSKYHQVPTFCNFNLTVWVSKETHRQSYCISFITPSCWTGIWVGSCWILLEWTANFSQLTLVTSMDVITIRLHILICLGQWEDQFSRIKMYENWWPMTADRFVHSELVDLNMPPSPPIGEPHHAAAEVSLLHPKFAYPAMTCGMLSPLCFQVTAMNIWSWMNMNM